MPPSNAYARVRPYHRLVRAAPCCILVALAAACSTGGTSDSGNSAGTRASAASARSTPLGTGWVYTANEEGESLTRVDLRTGAAVTIPIGIMAHNVQVAPDGRTILAVGSTAMTMEQRPGGSEHAVDAPGTLIVLPADATDTTSAIRFPMGHGASHVVTSRDGRRAFTTNSGDNAVIIEDLAARRAVDTVRTAQFPHGLRLSPDGRELYVACVEGDAVSVIDVDGMQEVARIPVGRAPVQVGFLPDGSRAYVTLRDDNSVAVIDTRTRNVLRKIPVGRGPIQLMATPDGRFVYIANQGTETHPDSTVSVIATDENDVVATIPTGHGAHGVAVSTDGSRAFITNTFANTMTVIDVGTQRALRSIPVGQEPGGVSYRRGPR